MSNNTVKPYSYNLSDELVIEIYKKFDIKPLGVNIIEDSSSKYGYKIEPCSLSDGSCYLF